MADDPAFWAAQRRREHELWKQDHERLMAKVLSDGTSVSYIAARAGAGSVDQQRIAKAKALIVMAQQEPGVFNRAAVEQYLEETKYDLNAFFEAVDQFGTEVALASLGFTLERADVAYLGEGVADLAAITRDIARGG